MTLEQFADLMQGLGYKAEKGEREKVKAVTEVPADAPAEAPAAEETPADATPEASEAPAEDTGPEMESFFTFTWGGFGRARQGGGGKPRGERGQGKPGGKPRGDRSGGKPGRGKGPNKGPRDMKPKSFQSGPKKEKAIDPDNPFAAALMGLKDKG
jgi:ATP-dependent RNA helicase SUPV3L1/SUV3